MTSKAGVAIGLAFSGIWWAIGSVGLSMHWRLPVGVSGLALITLLLIKVLIGRSSTNPGRSAFRATPYILALAFEAVAAPAAIYCLWPTRFRGFVVTAIAVIVGLHFLGLWRATRSTTFLWVALAMCAAAAAAALLPANWSTIELRQTATGFSISLILVASTFDRLRLGSHRRPDL